MSVVSTVTVREEQVCIPTYPVSAPEKSPLFIEKRAYQGSTGKVYPLPVTEKISDQKEDVFYQAVFLENEYLQVMILPELGGRIQRAYDKTNGYDFVYYNHVIKPALVGLTGPWISGGIEFNWPQHHRPTTYSPVDYTLSHNPDGSCSVYVGEIDPMYGTKGMAKITLYPGKSYIEIKGQLYNPTDFPQTFLWWANPAVPVNDYTFSVFPPDVNAVMDHGKRAVSTFPIATGEYYKYDYSAGVDISRYRNVKVPTSYMAAHSEFDFIGNYDESIEAGLLHIADHHISPGKKQWTWGNGDFGRSWDKNLTDSDGPYIELMTGVFTDNQPDFTWLKPHEEKNFVQYFMPYKGVGRVGNATKEAVVGICFSSENQAVLKVYTTANYENAQIEITDGTSKLYQKTVDLSPLSCFQDHFSIQTTPKNLKIKVTDAVGTTLVSDCHYQQKLEPIPEPAEPLKSPEELKTTEELYLAATHLEQYRHATYDPKDYYLEGLRRDPSDIRLNNGYGRLLLKSGNLSESITHFQRAIQKQTWKNPNPYHGECYFNLGLAYEKSGELDKAFDAFYKSTWSNETQAVGFYHLAALSARKQQYEQALEFIESALLQGWHNMNARNLKAALLRKLEMKRVDFLEESHKIDPLNMGILFEIALENQTFSEWKTQMRFPAHNYLSLSLQYMGAGLYDEAIQILERCEDANPIVFYYLSYAFAQKGDLSAAKQSAQKAESLPEDYCFPNRLEELQILESCLSLLDVAPMAEYYLGNLLYDKKQYQKAVYYWEHAVIHKPQFAMAHRNLSIAYYNKEKNPEKAFKAIVTACQLQPHEPRFCLERDQLAEKLRVSVKTRLDMLQQHQHLLQTRDALYLRYITLLNCNGQYEDALQHLSNHSFHPWEGGEGKVSAQYRLALTQLAKQSLQKQEYERAADLLKRTLYYPENLGEGKLPNVPDHQTYYWLGIAYSGMQKTKQAETYFRLAAEGDQTPSSVLYYNDQPSDFIYYQGLARQQLGKYDLAKKAFHQLISYGERHLFDQVSYDFFAVSLPEIEVYQEDIQLRNQQYCNYLRALGYMGLSRTTEAAGLFKNILQVRPNDLGALVHQSDLKQI